MINHSSTFISADDIQRIVTVLETGIVNDSEVTRELETKFINYLGVNSAKATSTGTLALCLALRTIGVGRGDEVLTTTFTCVDVLAAIQYVGACARFVDIDVRDYNLSSENFLERITNKTKAAIIPHMFGVPADMEVLASSGIPLIEDCAHSLGSTLLGKKLGSIGEIGVFSFHALKSLVTGEGGMVVSSNYDFHKSIPPYHVDYHLSNILSSLGLSQFSRLSESLAKRADIAKNYNELLEGEDLILPIFTRGSGSLLRYCVQLPVNTDVNLIKNRMAEEGVVIQRPVKVLLHTLYGNDYCPVAEKVFARLISLPAHLLITPEQQQTVAQILIKNIKDIK